MDSGEKVNPDAHRQAVEGERIVASESAWLIEQPHANGGSPLWYAGVGLHGSCKGLHGWTYDACKAMRFPTKADAEKHIESEQLRQQAARLIATEHQFDTFGPAPTDEQVDQYLADAGIDMTEATQRLRKMVDEAKARATPTPPTRDVERVIVQALEKLARKWCCKRLDDASRFPEVLGEQAPAIIAQHIKPLRDELERVKEYAKQRHDEVHTLQQQLAESGARVGCLENLITETVRNLVGKFPNPQPTPSAGVTA